MSHFVAVGGRRSATFSPGLVGQPATQPPSLPFAVAAGPAFAWLARVALACPGRQNSIHHRLLPSSGSPPQAAPCSGGQNSRHHKLPADSTEGAAAGMFHVEPWVDPGDFERRPLQRPTGLVGGRRPAGSEGVASWTRWLAFAARHVAEHSAAFQQQRAAPRWGRQRVELVARQAANLQLAAARKSRQRVDLAERESANLQQQLVAARGAASASVWSGGNWPTSSSSSTSASSTGGRAFLSGCRGSAEAQAARDGWFSPSATSG